MHFMILIAWPYVILLAVSLLKPFNRSYLGTVGCSARRVAARAVLAGKHPLLNATFGAARAANSRHLAVLSDSQKDAQSLQALSLGLTGKCVRGWPPQRRFSPKARVDSAMSNSNCRQFRRAFLPYAL